jgi:hypothetical protein
MAFQVGEENMALSSLIEELRSTITPGVAIGEAAKAELPPGGRWVTVNGTHIYVRKRGGEPIAGPKALKDFSFLSKVAKFLKASAETIKKGAEGAVKAAKGVASVYRTIKNFPEKAKKFVTDKDYRKEVMAEVKPAVAKALTSAKDRVVAAAKEEVHEWKTASGAVKKLANKQKISKEEKKALQTVIAHTALTAASAAIGAAGVASFFAGYAKGAATHVAAKAAGPIFDKIATGQHISHLTHLFAAAKDEDKEAEATLNGIVGMVSDEIQKVIASLSDDDLRAMIEAQMSKEK